MMMQMKRLLTIISVTVACWSCLKLETQQGRFNKHLVVEGRIEQGGRAEVMLSINKSFSEEFTEEELLDIVVRWAKVTISDSRQTEVLTGRYDKDYPTRFIYTSSMISGRPSETYTLTIQYGGGTWTASTTIPPAESFSEISSQWVSDSLYRITAEIPASQTGNSYMIECTTDTRSNFYRPALLGIIKGEEQNPARRITVNRPIDYTRITSYTTLFRPTDTVKVRLCSMSEFGYEFWSTWENNAVNSLNPIFPVHGNLPTNISGDATGIWCGYGTSYYRVTAPQKVSHEN